MKARHISFWLYAIAAVTAFIAFAVNAEQSCDSLRISRFSKVTIVSAYLDSGDVNDTASFRCGVPNWK